MHTLMTVLTEKESTRHNITYGFSLYIFVYYAEYHKSWFAANCIHL